MDILQRPKTQSFPVRERERHTTVSLNWFRLFLNVVCVFINILNATVLILNGNVALNSEFEDNTSWYSRFEWMHMFKMP